MRLHPLNQRRKFTAMTTDKMTLWGTPHSFYTGKVRSYLIKKGLPFREQTLADPHFHGTVVPTIRHMVVPVLELPDGSLLQDSAEIIETLEARHPENPDDPRHARAALRRASARCLRHRGPAGPGHALPLELPGRTGSLPAGGIRAGGVPRCQPGRTQRRRRAR